MGDEWLRNPKGHGSHAAQISDANSDGVAHVIHIEIEAVSAHTGTIRIEYVAGIDEEHRAKLALIVYER